MTPKRFTKKTLAEWLTKKFKSLDMPFTVSPEDVSRTYFNESELEGGATKMYILARNGKNSTS